jgi:ERCC4-type nuclease
MKPDLSGIRIAATRPDGNVARRLAARGMRIAPIVEDEGNVERYVLSERLAVERRTGSAFLNGIMDKTLFTSAIYLREHFAVPVLIVEGEVNYEYSMMDPQAVRGALSSMLLQYGMSVLSTPDPGETVELIEMLARQEQIGIPEISLIPKRKAATLPDMQRRVVEMLPGCGMVMARDLLHHFGTVRRIVDADERELRLIRGIGARKAKEICRVLSEEYEAVDTERQLEDAIEADPGLVFARPVVLLARQHHIFTEAGEKQIVDLVFYCEETDRLILAELKRGRLDASSGEQIGRYLDHARESGLLRQFLDSGAELRGLLVTIEPCEYRPPRPDVDVRLVDRGRAIAVLKGLRQAWQQQRLGDAAGDQANGDR